MVKKNLTHQFFPYFPNVTKRTAKTLLASDFICKKYANSMVFQNRFPLEILNRNKAETLTLLYIITVTLLSKK